jgi:O-antigen ligase
MERDSSMTRDLRLPTRSQARLVQTGLIAASLAAIAALAYLFPLTGPMFAAGSALMVGVAWLLLRKPALGPIAIIVAALAVPFQIGTGTQSTINLALGGLAALVGLWALDALVRPERRGWTRSRPVTPLLGLVFVTLFAFVAGQFRWFGLTGASMATQIGQTALYLLSIAAFLLVANRVSDERWLARLVWVFLALAAVHVATLVIPGARVLPVALTAAQGSVFWTWLAALAAAQALINNRLAMRWRLALLALSASPFYLFLLRTADWTAGWLPALVAVFIVLWLGARRWALVVTAGGILYAALNWASVYEKLFTGGGEYGQAWSIYTRGEAWTVGLELAAHSPIIGFGPGNYYFYTPILTLIEWNVNFVVHNQYIDLLLQVGIFGVVCFAWFAAEIGLLGWRLRERVPEGFARAYVYACIGGLVGTLVAGMLVDWVLPNAYNIGLAGFRGSVLAWLFLGGLLVLERCAKRGEGAYDGA